MITLRQARLKKSKTFISKSSYPGCEGAILYNLVCSGKFISSGIAVSLFGMDFEWPTDSFPVSEDLGKLFADDVFKGDSEDK